MTATRSRKEEKQYKSYLRTNSVEGCEFCRIGPSDEQFVESTQNFKVIRNIFAYSLWDGQDVDDHLMLLPKKHTDSLADIQPEHAAEWLKLVGKYEKRHYNLYARAPASKIKSVVHQHTHLIRPRGVSRRFVLLLRKPYLRFRI